MMKLKWFENPENVVYVDADEFADNFGKEIGIEKLRNELDKFRADPRPEGVVLKGKKRTSIRLLIPDMMFDKHIEMGETVWLYVGETYPAYCIYWNSQANCCPVVE